MPGTVNSLPLGAGSTTMAPAAAPPTRGEIERKLSMRSAEPPRPRRRTSNPGPSYVGQSGNESDSSFQSSLAGPITATSPITSSSAPISTNINVNANPGISMGITPNNLGLNNINNSINNSGNTNTNTTNTNNNNNNNNNNIGGAGSVNANANINPGSIGGSNLSIPPKGTSVLSSIQERGERSNPFPGGGSDQEFEEGDEDDEAGTELEEDEVLVGQDRVDGEELKRGMDEERVVKSGYLMKKGEKRKNWKKRWFVLRTEKLAYYRDEKEYMLCQILSLREIHSVVSVQLKKHNYAFGIITAKRTFYVRATSQGEMEGWVHAVNDARRNLAESDEKARSPSHMVGATGQGQVQMQGAGQGSANIPIPMATGASASTSMGNIQRGMGQSMSTSESFGQYGVSPGYTEMSLGSYPAQRGTGSIPHSFGGAYGSQPQTPSALHHLGGSQVGGQQQQQQGMMIPGIESQLDKLAINDQYQAMMMTHAGASGGGMYSGNTSGMNTPTVSDRARGIPLGTTSTRRDPSTSSVSSIPIDAGPIPAQQAMGGSFPQAFVPTSSDEEDDAFVPRSLGQGSSNIAGMMAMSPTTRFSPMGHPPTPGGGTSLASPTPIQTDPKKVILNGYLMKLGTRGKKTWRKRWFVLTSGELVYTKSHMDTKVHRQIPLSNILDAIEFEPVEPVGSEDSDSDSARDLARSPASPRKPRHLHRERASGRHQTRGTAGSMAVQHAFQVITPQRTFKLCAPSEEEEIKWVAALRALINRERGMMSPTTILAPALPAMSTSASASGSMLGQGQGSGQVIGFGQGGGGMGTRGHSQAPTPALQVGSEETSYFGLTAGGHGQQQVMSPSVPATPSGGGFTYPVKAHSSQQQQQQQQQQQLQSTQGGRPTRASLPPLVTTASHTRTRSATQSAKAAVAEVVRRFNPDSSAG